MASKFESAKFYGPGKIYCTALNTFLMLNISSKVLVDLVNSFRYVDSRLQSIEIWKCFTSLIIENGCV